MRLIDADELIEKYGGWYTEEGTEEGFIGTIETLVNTMPSAQPNECYGYDTKNLILFSIACRNAGIENEDLKQFVLSCEFAWEMMRKEFEKSIDKSITDMISGAKMEVEHETD